MADTLQFDLVSPERLLASVAARDVRLPGAEGDMTVLPDHARLITTLRPGIVRVSAAEGEREFVVTGGFAEINPEGVSVLAERAVPREDITQAQFREMIEEANARLQKAQDGDKEQPGLVDEAAKLLADMVAMGEDIGLSAH
ncbi:MAG: F0F1 ATP synthase subunit epsilon [Roseovarius sp.]